MHPQSTLPSTFNKWISIWSNPETEVTERWLDKLNIYSQHYCGYLTCILSRCTSTLMLSYDVSVQRQGKKKPLGQTVITPCIKISVCYGSQGWYLQQPTVILCSGSRNMIISQKSALFSQSPGDVCVMRTFGSKIAPQQDHKHKNKIAQISPL